MPSDKLKFNAKKGVTPVIRKLYNNHVKLLSGRNEKPSADKEKKKISNEFDQLTSDIKEENQETEAVGRKSDDGHVYENMEFNHLSSVSRSFSEEVFADIHFSTFDQVDHSNVSVIAIDEGSRYYENVFLPSSNLAKTSSPLIVKESEEKNNGSIILDSSTDSNVTVIEVSDQPSSDENKLKIVINNFDKIISEYAPPKKKEKPKLQKAKTCSIIESKCILKKQVSSPTNGDEKVFRSLDLNLTKTKSLFNLDSKSLHSGEGDFWSLELKAKNGSNLDKAKPEVRKKQNIDKADKDRLDQSSDELEQPNSVRVKDVVKKLNSLGDDSKNIQRRNSAPTKAKNCYSNALAKRKSIDNKLKLFEPGKEIAMPRAISCSDIAIGGKKLTQSKIPVKKTLSKTFPSTPSDLNCLDRTLRCTPIDESKQDHIQKSVSMHSIIKGLEQQQSGSGKNKTALKPIMGGNNKSQSSQNLPKISLAKKSNFESARKDAENFKAGFRSGTQKPPILNKDRSLKKNGVINKTGVKQEAQRVLGKTQSLNSLQAEKNKIERNLTYTKPKNTSAISRDYVNASKIITAKEEQEGKKLGKSETAGSNVVTKEEREFIKKFVENLKINPQLLLQDNANFDGAWKNQKLKTFGVQKATLEPKFGGGNSKVVLKRSDTYNKNDRVREFQQIEKIEQNLKTAKEIFMTTNLLSCEYFNNPCVRANCELKIESFMNILKQNEVQEADVRNDGEVYRSYLKYDFGLNNFDKLGDFDKSIFGAAQSKLDNIQVKDYGSDDNSDDSGNISNELELEFEAVSERIFSSSESLEENSGKDDFGSSGSKVVLDGKSDDEKIFFRSGVLTQLEAQRDERLSGMVVSLQAHCRGYLARKKLAQRKLQDLAVRCIQRNVRKFLLVRDWPWWRLLVRVTPLLNVHRTEEELKTKTEELELLKAKLEKLEAERTTLKHDNDKLEAKLSEMTADLAEEHSTSTLAGERLDAEQSERVRLERELSEVQQKNKDLQNSSERLEMELLYARSELNGISEDDEDGDGEAVYKQRYERVVRELEFTKRRLQQQHEDDLEQLVGLKKQLEKKLTDAYEEVEEQRQVVGQWKRKVQKLNGEMNDLKLLLEEQSSRNNLLEKKQRKFDSEIQLLQDELKKEKQAKDRLSREKEVVMAEKYTIESNLADVRLELDLKEEKLSVLQREFDELTYGGKTEEEVAVLRKQKIECERKMHDQEEELDELAGQVQLLEQAKLKLEMTLEQQRKTGKKETQQHEEELEEVRCNAQKKVKALEAQLENEHEERTSLLREKHELERRLTAALENDRTEKACDEAVLQRLKRDLKRTKALLRDTQAQLERQKAETPNKALIRQLRNQIEDLDCARLIAVKAKQTVESDLSETQAQLEEAVRQKNEAEERSNAVSREKADLQTQVEENEEELAEVLKKYKTTIQQMSLDQIALQEQVALVSELEIERNSLKEQLAELTTRLESVESMGDASSHMLVKRTELKVKELESKLDLEQTTRTRLEVQISRLKEAVEKLQHDLATSRTKEQQAQDQIRKLQRSLRELKDEHNTTLTKENESLLKRKELEKRCETLEAEAATARADLRIALKRIEDLQAVIQNELEDSTENSESDHDSYSSDDSVNTFLVNHKMSTSKSSSMQFDGQRRLSNTSRSSTSSSLAKDVSYA